MAPRENGSGAKHLKIEEIARILALHEEGISSRKITAHLGRDKATIHPIIVKAKELDPTSIPERKKGFGRARKMTNVMVGIVKRQIAKYPTMTALSEADSGGAGVRKRAHNSAVFAEGPEDAQQACSLEASSH
jgi:hypothetical protein